MVTFILAGERGTTESYYDWMEEQDGRLALAYFSPEHKYFDQHLRTVKNETTV